MIKLLEKQLDINLLKRSAIFALIFCLLFNSIVFIDKYSYYKSGVFSASLALCKDFVFVFISTFIFFFGLNLHRYLFIFGGLFLFITGALASYYLYYFDITPNLKAMETLFDQDSDDIFEAFSVKLTVWLTFVLFVFFSCIKQFGSEHSAVFLSKLLSGICLFLTINSIISPHYRLLAQYFPLQYLNGAYLYFAG